MTLLDGVTVRPSGEAAVVLELGDRIDPDLHDRVLALDEVLTASPPPGVVEVVPTYRSLLLRIDPLRTSPDDVVAALARRPAPGLSDRVAREHEVHVSFARDDAEDLDEVARRTGLTAAGVVAMLVGTPLRLYCYGFVPGFAYLGGLPPGLHLSRRETPRAPVAPGAVLLAAGQAALCPRSMPTGWWVVGRTDRRLFAPDGEPPVPFAAGDVLRLVAVD